jgi:hypothetical protein
MRLADKFLGLSLALQICAVGSPLYAQTSAGVADGAPSSSGLSSHSGSSSAAASVAAEATEGGSDKQKVNTLGLGSMVNPLPTPSQLIEAGPAEDKRRNLLIRILSAKEKGIGIDAYLNAFGALEHSVKTGESEAALVKRIDSLNSSLDDQLKRSAILKTQRPAPPVAASAFPPSSSGSSGGGGGDMLQQLKEKYGNQVPDNLKDKLGGQIPDSIKNQLPAGLGNMSPDQLKELVKQFRK